MDPGSLTESPRSGTAPAFRGGAPFALPSCNPVPRWLARVRAAFPGACARYLELDPRSLGLTRIYLGGLLLLEVARRIPFFATFYTDEGLLPRAPVWRHGGEFLFSIFFAAPHLWQASLMLAACALVFALLALGWHTRVVHALAFVCILSLHARTPMFEDGSETSLRLLTFWTMFLPMGACFSLDARRARASAAPETRPALSLAVLAVLLQLSAIYFFNAWHKDGVTWREGSTIHYVLHQERIVTWLGWVVRPYVTPQISALMSWGAIATEAALPLLIMSPLQTKLTRRLAIALGVGLHAGIALLANLGPFSGVMFGFFMLLLSDRDWELLAKSRLRAWLPAWSTARAVYQLEPQALSTAVPADRKPRWRFTPAIREGLVVVFAIALTHQLLRENRVPRWLKPHAPPRALRMLIEYPRLFEGWSMFAPEAPTGDYHVFVGARTVDGRLVDPLNELASRVANVPLSAIPERLGQDDAYCDYIANIVGHHEYYPALEAWVFRYHERTGNPNDRITSFNLFTIEDDAPPPGETEPRNAHRTIVLHAKRPSSAAGN